MTSSLAVAIVTVPVATALIWLGSSWLEDASATLSIHYDLPPVVQGGIVAAVGSSFPELASVVIAALLGSLDLGVGAVVGSAIFNILVIPGVAVVGGKGTMSSTRTLVHKETLFYLLSIVVLLLTLSFARIYNPVGDASIGRLTRPLVLFPLAVYGFYLFLQWQDTEDYAGRPKQGHINVRKKWLLLAAGLLLILVAVERLVDAVLLFGDRFGTPEFLWGVTIVAAATSLPDLIVSLRAAKDEHDVASMSNVIGSNIFDLLVVIPVGVLIVGSASVNFGIAAPMFGALLAATAVLFVFLRTGLVLGQREAYLLLSTYGLFLLWIGAETFGFLHVLPATVFPG
jgi:cation:H+ antiporter